MKLLDWMQHKFRQTNSEHLTEFAPRNSCAYPTGQPPLDDLQYHRKSHSNVKARNTTQRDRQFRKSFACMESARADNKLIEEESAALSGLFHGFLAIGTLATETVANEPETPTFATAVENIMSKETEATENELKLINDELEKMLEHDGNKDQSATITLVGKPSEEIENNENGQSVCPLQDYLLSSVVGLPEITTTKKEHRTSLGELFQKTKMVEVIGAKGNKIDKQKEKETEKSAVHLMKKILKGKTLYSSSRRSTSDKKPRKILKMFSRKVHPECVPVAPEYENHSNEEYQNKNRKDDMLSEYITIYPNEDTCKRGGNCSKSYTPYSACCMSDSNGNKECWIKSDDEFLVLEL